jgi:Tol biopolymer transport system component
MSHSECRPARSNFTPIGDRTLALANTSAARPWPRSVRPSSIRKSVAEPIHAVNPSVSAWRSSSPVRYPTEVSWNVRAVLCTLVLPACGRVGFDTRGDANVDALGMFGPPQLITELTDPTADDDPTLTGDELELYFASYRTGSIGMDDIFYSVRSSVDDPWPPPQPVPGLNSTSQDESPGVSPDGLELYFESARGGNGDIWVSIRNTRGAPWPTPVRVAELSSTDDDYQVQPSRTNLRLVMYRATAGPGGRDIFEATRSMAGGTWSSPQLLSVSTSAGDRSPCLSASELEIIFSSDRMSATVDVQDLYTAHRSSVDAPFESPLPITELNTGFDEDDPWMSPDGHTLYFSSDRDGNPELYVARR